MIQSLKVSSYQIINTPNINRWSLDATSQIYAAGVTKGIPDSNSTLLTNPVGITRNPMGNINVDDAQCCQIFQILDEFY